MRAGPILLLVFLLLSPVAAAASTVKVMGGFFDPATIQVRPGDAITWVSDDPQAHTVTSMWDQGETFDEILREGESFTWTFPEEGTFTIHCRPHSGMEMSVVVASVDGGAAITSSAGASSIQQMLIPAVALILGVAVGSFLLSWRRRQQ